MSSRNSISRELHESIRVVLGKNVDVSFRCPVRMETKGDKTDNKVLVFSRCRLFIMSWKTPTKLEFHFHYLEISAIESRKPNQLCLFLGEKQFTFYTVSNDSEQTDQIIFHLYRSIKLIFPLIPFRQFFQRLDVCPESRIQSLFDLNSVHENKDVTPCGNFTNQYACMCDLHCVPYREEVSWDVDTIYLSHDTRELCLQDFDHLEPRDLIAIISVLEYNTWFTKLRASNVRLVSEAAEQILQIVRRSRTIQELYLDNIGIRWDFLQKFSIALLSNPDSSIHTIDLSNNVLEDKGINHLSNTISKLQKGLAHLNLARTGLSSKGVNNLAHSLSLNHFIPNTLTYLNLADNSLKEDVNNLYNFLAQPNTVTHLDLSGTDITLDILFGAILRGCSQKLSHINLSRNTFSHKKSKDPTIPASFKQFFHSTVALKYLNLSSTKLPSEALKNMLLGLTCNDVATGIELDLSCNNLGSSGAHVMDTCLSNVRNLTSLDISDNVFDLELANIVNALSKMKSLRRLSIGKNFNNMKSKYIGLVIDTIVQLIQEEESALEYLSLADSKLKSDLYGVVNSLATNRNLLTVDISGNQMGDNGARILAKALQINNHLRALIYDKNNISSQGFHDLAYALEMNYTMRYMPFPVHDACVAMKTTPEKTESALKKIENLLHRNVSPQKFSNGQAFRLQQGFLLSSSQQLVDRLIVQTQDALKATTSSLTNNDDTDSVQALKFIQDAENSKQLLTSLHSVVLQREETENYIEPKLKKLSEELHKSTQAYLQETIDSMLKKAKELCPHVLADSTNFQTLQKTSSKKGLLPADYISQCIVEQAGTDILNKINELNLVAASHISDQILNEVIDSLSKNYKVLVNTSIKKPNSTPDVLRSRVRLDSEDSPKFISKRKSVQCRKLRPQSVIDSADVLKADGVPDLLPRDSGDGDKGSPAAFPPKLEHLGKGRPKRPKTKAPTKPVLQADSILEADHNFNEGLNTFFQRSHLPVQRISQISEDSNSDAVAAVIQKSEPEKNQDVKQTNSLEKEKKDKSLESVPTTVQKNETEKTSESKKTPVEKEKKDRGARLVHGLSSVFGRISQDKQAKSKQSDEAEKVPANAKVEGDPIKTKEVVTEPSAVIEKGSETQLRQPAAIPKAGVGGDILAEMKARQEKRFSVHSSLKGEESSENVNDVIQPNSVVNTKPPISPTNGLASKPVVNKEELEKVQLTSSSPKRDSKSSEDLQGDHRSASSPSLQEDRSSPTNKPSLPVKPRPPPIAPKPRPRSMIGIDVRKSGEFSPLSDGSSLDESVVIGTPDQEENSTDSGLMGSRDSLSLISDAPVDAGRRKASSLPRSSQLEPAGEPVPRSHSLTHKEHFSASKQLQSLESDKTKISSSKNNTDFQVDDIVNV